MPKQGANLVALEDPEVKVQGGDDDDFLDNCETARARITVENSGGVPLTNVRIISVTPLTHPDTVILTPLPAPIASSLDVCGKASGKIDFEPHGMNFDETTRLEVVVTSDELDALGQTRTTIIKVDNVESDFESHAKVKWGFEADLEGWVVTSGTFDRQPGGANGTGFHLSSTQCLDGQCDHIRSPLVRLQQTPACRSSLDTTPRYRSRFPTTAPTSA